MSAKDEPTVDVPSKDSDTDGKVASSASSLFLSQVLH